MVYGNFSLRTAFSINLRQRERESSKRAESVPRERRKENAKLDLVLELYQHLDQVVSLWATKACILIYLILNACYKQAGLAEL